MGEVSGATARHDPRDAIHTPAMAARGAFTCIAMSRIQLASRQCKP